MTPFVQLECLVSPNFCLTRCRKEVRITTVPCMHPKAKRLLQILFEKSFRYSREPVYPLSSGVMSRYYIDCKTALSYPEARELMGELMFERLSDAEVDAVGGMAIGAYPLAIVFSDVAYRKAGKSVRAFVVRKEPKKHGLKKHIEGDVQRGDRVLIVEDVITSGKSTVEAIARVREEELQVVRAIALIDRQELQGKNAVEQCGIPCEALFTLQDLVDLVDPGKESN